MSLDHGLGVRFATPDRGQKADPTMGASRVVVPDIAAQDVLEMATRDDEDEVQALSPYGPNKALRIGIRRSRQLHLMETVRPEPSE